MDSVNQWGETIIQASGPLLLYGQSILGIRHEASGLDYEKLTLEKMSCGRFA